MKLADFDKLKKVMQLTSSENDHEALSSVRAANAMLKRSNLTWEDVFARTVKVTDEIESYESTDRAVREEVSRKRQDIREAFEVVLASDLRGDFASFIESLHDQFERKGWLSAAQEDALMKTMRRVRAGRDR